MKIRVPLRDTTMKESHQWLELGQEGDEYRVSLCNSKGGIADSSTPIAREVLEALVSVAPGVILKDGPLRFFKTENDFRVSFTEMAAEDGPSGYDRLDAKELTQAIQKLLGPEKHAKKKESKPASKKEDEKETKKKAAPKSKRHAISSPNKGAKRSP